MTLDIPTLVDTLRGLDSQSVFAFVLSLPYMYQDWWLNLYRESPIHIFVETTLVVFVLWLLFVRRTVDPVKTSDVSKFTDKEVQWLIDTWTPEPLVPVTSSDRLDRRMHGSKMVFILHIIMLIPYVLRIFFFLIRLLRL